MVFADEKRAMLVLPGSHRVDFTKAKAVMGVGTIRLANEYELRVAFPDCEVGAMPPFGELYELPVFVDDDLAANETIVCQASTHTDTMSLRYTDFARVAQPMLGRLCTRAG